MDFRWSTRDTGAQERNIEMTLIALAEITPWFAQHQAGLIGGIGGGVGGSVCGLLGAAAGVCIPRGIGRTYILGGMWMFVAIGIASLVAMVVAIIAGQPAHVWLTFLVPGIVFTTVCGGLLPVVRAQYGHAEQRRMDAEAIRRSSATGA